MKPELRIIQGGKKDEESAVVACIKPLDRDVAPSPVFRLEMRRRLLSLNAPTRDRTRAA